VQKLSVRHVSTPPESARRIFADQRAALKVRSKDRLRSADRRRCSETDVERTAGLGGAGTAAVRIACTRGASVASATALPQSRAARRKGPQIRERGRLRPCRPCRLSLLAHQPRHCRSRALMFVPSICVFHSFNAPEPHWLRRKRSRRAFCPAASIPSPLAKYASIVP